MAKTSTSLALAKLIEAAGDSVVLAEALVRQ
jgi:hypothetical protein